MEVIQDYTMMLYDIYGNHPKMSSHIHHKETVKMIAKQSQEEIEYNNYIKNIKGLPFHFGPEKGKIMFYFQILALFKKDGNRIPYFIAFFSQVKWMK